MTFPSIHSFSSYVFSMQNHLKEHLLSHLSSQQKKIAGIALAIFCCIVAYSAVSYFFAKKKASDDNEPALDPSPKQKDKKFEVKFESPTKFEVKKEGALSPKMKQKSLLKRKFLSKKMIEKPILKKKFFPKMKQKSPLLVLSQLLPQKNFP